MINHEIKQKIEELEELKEEILEKKKEAANLFI
jgi:hypothetical protein